MTFSRIGRLRLTAACLVALAAGSLAACAPEPEPTPTPTAAFSSEEDAFAAAEEVYREYVSALNGIDASDPSTFEPLFALTTDAVNASDREAFSAMHAEGYEVDGDTRVVSFEGTEADPPFEAIKARVCLDVSEVTVVDADGESQVNPERPERYAVDVGYQFVGDELVIASSEAVQDPSCARS